VTWPAADNDVPAAGEAGRLVVTGLTKSFASNSVLRGIDLDVAGGSIAAVLGPSGCGKTTLLRVVAGFLTPDSGRGALSGAVLFESRRSLPPERRRIGIVPQEGALFGHLNVAENVGFGVPRGVDKASRISEMLALVGLQGLEEARPFELSGGQQQRVALARALAAEPALVLLDEPFSSLDAALRVHVREEIGRVLRRANCTAVLVTHDQQEALSLADHVAVMLGGRIAQAGAPHELYTAPVSLAVATFVGEAVILPGQVTHGIVHTALGRHGLVHRPEDGAATVVVRPEQIVFDENGVMAQVIEYRYYGADAKVRCRLDTGVEVVARVPGVVPIADGMRAGLRVEGDVLAYR
jgi:iron(III) transport system ATP-binding protein